MTEKIIEEKKMSRIIYKLSDLATAEQIKWLNALTSKISNCGNDIIAIDVDIHGYSDLHPFLRLLTDIHTEYGENKNRLVTTTNSICPYLPHDEYLENNSNNSSLLSNEEHSLLKKVFVEYFKQLNNYLKNEDDIMKDYFLIAKDKLKNLALKLERMDSIYEK